MYTKGQSHYTIVLNSNNRINKSTSNENDCEYYFDWSTMPEGKYRVTYSLTKIFTAPPTAFENLIASKTPWGLYKPSFYSSTTGLLKDLIGNGRDAACGAVSLISSPAGNGNTVPIPVLSGTALSTIIWPPGSIPSQYTMCSLMRYTNQASMGRLLAAYGGENENFGAYRGNQATIYDGNIEGCNRTLPFGSLNWLNMVSIRGSSIPAPGHVLVNRLPSGGGSFLMNTAVGRLAINGFVDGRDRGAFEMGAVIIFDQILTAPEMVIVSDALHNLLTTGFLK
jgi:hypothetical protein